MNVFRKLTNKEFAKFEHERNINTNIKTIFKTSPAASILNRFFTFVFVFSFMLVIRKLTNISGCQNERRRFQSVNMLGF